MESLQTLRMVTDGNDEDIDVGSALWWLYCAISIFLVLFAGIMSGLTLGLMSISPLDIEVLMQSGTPQQQKQASTIYPVVKKQHHLLVTLLLCNAGAMEALPLFLDRMANPYVAIIMSVTLVLLFGEIIPQAICSRFGLAVGASCIWLVTFLMIVCYPIAYPIGKLLDTLLGHEDPLFRRNQLKALVSIHGTEAGRGGELSHDETTIISGALDLTTKTAEEAMTPIESTFSLDVNAKLDGEQMGRILARGHSRLPVYQGDPKNIIGVLLVKNLLTIRPEDETPISNVSIRRIPRMEAGMPLYNVLNEFQKGSSHMAAVVKKKKVAQSTGGGDKLADQAPGTSSTQNQELEHRNFFESVFDHLRGGENGRQMGKRDAVKLASSEQEAESSYLLNSGSEAVVNAEEAWKSVQAAELAKENEAAFQEQEAEEAYLAEQARLGSQSELDLEKGGVGNKGPKEGRTIGWRAKALKGVEPYELGWRLHDPREQDEVIGIITLEDVIEELLQEEIVDETDEYIDVHRKIRVAAALKKQINAKDTRQAGNESSTRVLTQTRSSSFDT